MNISLVFVLAMAVLHSSVSLANSGSTEESMPEFGIELNTCTPDGLINSSKEKWNPKDFWIRQNVILGEEVHSRWKYDGSYCRNVIINDPEKTECLLFYRNLFDSIAKCYKTSKILCRKYGGFC